MIKEKDFNEEISKLLKVIRKQYNVHQQQMSSILGLSQSAISKIESGKGALSLVGYTKLCLEFNIPTNAYLLGYIDNMNKVELGNDSFASHSFKINERLTEFPSIAVREIKPFIEYIKDAFGETYLDNTFKDLNTDPLYFYKMDNLISPSFLVDISTKIIEDKKTKLKDVFCSKTFYLAESHGAVLNSIPRKESLFATLKAFVGVSNLYDCNYKRKVSKKNGSCIQFTMQSTPQFNEYIHNWSPRHKKVLDSYYYEFTKGICSISDQQDFKMEDISSNGKECIYQINI